MLKPSQVYVTGNVGISTQEEAKLALEAFRTACVGRDLVTIYVIGQLFGEGIDHDAAERFMATLPGRKILVYGPDTPAWQKKLKYWFDAGDRAFVAEWGQKIIMRTEPVEETTDSIVMHVSSLVDTPRRINVEWHQWDCGRYGPGGLQTLYGMATYAAALKTGFATV